MSYLLVTANFPGVSKEQKVTIYRCLDEKGWVKITKPGRAIDTVWQKEFKFLISAASATQFAIDEFIACSQLFCEVKLVLHWGPNEPVKHG